MATVPTYVKLEEKYCTSQQKSTKIRLRYSKAPLKTLNHAFRKNLDNMGSDLIVLSNLHRATPTCSMFPGTTQTFMEFSAARRLGQRIGQLSCPIDKRIQKLLRDD